MKHIHKCTLCSTYTMKETCSCGGKTVQPKPPKFSPEDKYGKYRRQVKKEELKEKGLY
ncbi:TPA: RNA-protein complex protein Nop10 [Candidatus Woesearchaeota archaeon]|nr:ribosome biogenesis protein [archaeon]HIJ11633.1 RNA-protein complex protein Nop10 [Candidatus Woesearchaeota archaeon]